MPHTASAGPTSVGEDLVTAEWGGGRLGSQLDIHGGFPVSGPVAEAVCNAGDVGSASGPGEDSWIWKWQPTPVFLPGESHGQRSLAGYGPRSPREADMTEHSLTQTPTDPPRPGREGHPSTDGCVAPLNAVGRGAYYRWV